MTIRPADMNDLETIMEIYSYAREQMRLSGNPEQWGNDRPSPKTIQEDIQKERSYVIIEQNRICGVFAFMIGPDPTYRMIENGEWLNNEPYGTLHRIAGNGQARGILAKALSFCEAQIDNIRIDTHDDNQIMLHLLVKYGYHKCGHIYVEDGSRRTAFQKCLKTVD